MQRKLPIAAIHDIFEYLYDHPLRKLICYPLKENREQVTQVCFKIWTISWHRGENNSSVIFCDFCFLHTLICFLSHLCNF